MIITCSTYGIGFKSTRNSGTISRAEAVGKDTLICVTFGGPVGVGFDS
jgi:hypothetical protein